MERFRKRELRESGSLPTGRQAGFRQDDREFYHSRQGNFCHHRSRSGYPESRFRILIPAIICRILAIRRLPEYTHRMSESGKIPPVIKKSYEVAYALCRIAEKIPEKHFADALTNEGIKILGFAAEEEYCKAEKALAAVEYFIKLGTGVCFIDFTNGEILLGEIALLNEMIAGLLNVPKAEPADLSGIFTPIEKLTPSVILDKGVSPAIQDPGSSDISFLYKNNPAIVKVESGNNPAKSGNENSAEIVELIKSGNRQGAILEKIRQSGNCRIKDFQDLFPDCSERTLRYDLRSLTEQNLIEKIGTGGPAVFYKSRG